MLKGSYYQDQTRAQGWEDEALQEVGTARGMHGSAVLSLL